MILGANVKLCEDPIEGVKLTTTGYNRSMFLPCFSIFFLSLTDLKNLSQIPAEPALNLHGVLGAAVATDLSPFDVSPWRQGRPLVDEAPSVWLRVTSGLMGWKCGVSQLQEENQRNFLRTLRRSSAQVIFHDQVTRSWNLKKTRDFSTFRRSACLYSVAAATPRT